MSLSPLKSSQRSGFSRRRKFPFATVFFSLAVLAAAAWLVRAFFGVTSDLHSGHKAWEAGQMDLAESRFRGILEKNPDSAPAYDGLGMVANRRGDLEEASRDYRKAMSLGLNRGKAFPHEKTGSFFIHQGNYRSATVEFRHALDLTPDSWKAHLGLAECLHATGGFADAMAEYRRVLQAKPALPEAQKGLEKARQSLARGITYYLYDRNNQPLARQTYAADGSSVKSYPLEQFAAHVIGVDSQKAGKTGLERSLQTLFPGNEVQLTLDTRIQKAADAALGWKKGSVVVIDPASGEIMAVVNHPSYNPNAIERDFLRDKARPTHPLKHRAFDGLYEPGSIVKIITAAAALESHVDMNAIFPVDTKGSILLDGKPFWDWRNQGRVHSLKEALDVSSNIALAKVGFALGADRLYEYTTRFGFGAPDDMGFTLPGFGRIDIMAAESVAPMPADNRYALAERACGLGLDYRITPLHACMLAATIANRGLMMKPMLVKEVRNVAGEVLFVNKPTAIRKAIDPETADKLREYMIDTTEKGIGRKARVTGVQVAGKTGTSRTSDKGLDAWFICFAPADKPQFAIAVLAEAEGTGMDVAAPIAKEIIQAIVK